MIKILKDYYIETKGIKRERILDSYYNNIYSNFFSSTKLTLGNLCKLTDEQIINLTNNVDDARKNSAFVTKIDRIFTSLFKKDKAS